jgi:ABC-type microcin C transport system permease subunit YejE
MPLKTNNDRAHTPAYTRPAYGDGISERDMSVGDVLRSARKALILRQIILFFLVLAIIATFIAVVALGAFNGVFNALVDRLLG